MKYVIAWLLGVPLGVLIIIWISLRKVDRNKNIYIANIVKCRPPANRNPEEDECMACMNYLRNQVILVKPEIIVLLR